MTPRIMVTPVIMTVPMAVIVLAIVFGIRAIAKRQNTVSEQRTPRYAAPNRGPSSGGGASMRRFFWGVVIGLIFVLALTTGVRQVRMEPLTAARVYESAQMREAAEQEMQAVTEKTEILAPPPSGYKTSARPPAWFKPEPHPTADAAPKWHATIPQSTFPSVRELNPRDELLESIAGRLQADLHLHAAPSRGFVSNSRYVRTIKTERKTLDEKDPKYGEVETITTEVELTPDGWQELGRMERFARSETRMEWAARGLGLFTVLLGAIAAFVRLDDWTKGYYSGRLFLAATSIVAGLGFAILSV
jgi:hypothetical protein